MKSLRLPGGMSYPVKLSLFGATLGIALIGVLATYFRRRRRPKTYRNISNDSSVVVDEVDASYIQQRAKKAGLSPIQKLSHNGDISHSRRSLTPHMSKSNSFSTCDDDTISSSTVTIQTPQDTENLTPLQLYDVGLEALNTAIASWEEALNKIDDIQDEKEGADIAPLQTQLHQLLARGYSMQDSFQRCLFQQVTTTAAIDAALEQMDRDYEQKVNSRRSLTGSMADDSSDQDSFVSALDMADLSDLDTQIGSLQHLVLYEAALLELKHGTIPCRTLRTKMVNCPSDTEFLAKLHCVRFGFQEMFKDESVRTWFMQCGKKMISDLLIKAERDPEDFQAAYDDMFDYVAVAENWPEIEEELRYRGVKLMTFFDIVIDFILFDAFDDLECPPSSVLSVIQNRWLSNGFKETALSTAVWSVLKAKRRLLKVPKGFISHFYAISEHVSPVMAWGFLGPDGPLRTLCYFFKDEVTGFMEEVFSFHAVRFTTVEQLADDIHHLSRKRLEIASARLAS